MSTATLVIGASGTGKSTSIRNLNPETTFVISVLDKPLPIKGYKKHYIPIKSWDDKEGNYYSSDDWAKIIKCINMVDKTRPDIEVLIVDDVQYIMANEYMRRASESGFNKFVELGQHMWSIISALISLRPTLYSFALSHNDIDNTGKSKLKTIGKMLDEKITLEGMFTTIFHSIVIDDSYKFLTQTDGVHTAKSPLGMFDEKIIDNDLNIIVKKMKEYNLGE